MASTPRKLKLLIIDDQLIEHSQSYEVPSSIERWSLGKDLIGIDSWLTALQFWSSFHGDEVPDLVVADVRFICDRTSPLSILFKPGEGNIPTGLSHLKTFAALSRIVGRPIGVCCCTMDPGLWEEQTKCSEPEKKAMGYLAAHEIGELAAILGDSKEIWCDGTHIPHLIRNCFKWLETNSANRFEDGLRKAVRNYRRRLYQLLTTPGTPSIFVHPSDQMQLLGWCSQMQKNPQLLDSQQGLRLSYHNGKHDLISLESLFADFGGITKKVLEPSSFSYDGLMKNEPWELDDDRRPRIGAFFHQICLLNVAFEEAVQAVKVYEVCYPLPKNYKPLSLAEIKKRYSVLAAGLTVLFQFIRIEQKRVEQWESSFENDSWDPKGRQFISGKPNPTYNLKRTLQKLIDLIRVYAQEEGYEPFMRVDLFEREDSPKLLNSKINVKHDDHNKDWVKWHFERLVDARVLDYKVKEGEEYYTLNSDWRKSRLLSDPPPAPRIFPRIVATVPEENLETKKGNKKQREPNRVQWLRASLGYEISDGNSVERALADAFGGVGINKDREEVGRDFINNFKEPDLPFFMLELCREYASKHLEWPQNKWLKWLLPTSTGEEPR